MDRQSIKILKYISKRGPVFDAGLKSAFPKLNIYHYIEFLLGKNFIKGAQVPYSEYDFFNKTSILKTRIVGPYEITPAGRSYLESRYSEYKKPIIINLITALCSVLISNIDRIARLVISLLEQLS